MANLKENTLPLKTRQRTFEDGDRIFTPAVALVDAGGDQTGTNNNPLPTRSASVQVLEHILTEMRTMNAHLAEITGSEFDEEEHEVEL